jgi:hypothetical protein
MRINVYTEELLRDGPADPDAVKAEIVTADYVSSRTGEPMTNYGLRVYLKSHPDLHYVPPRDDDRSAITFWCGPKEKNVFEFLDMVRACLTVSTLKVWHDKTEKQVKAAAEAEAKRSAVHDLKVNLDQLRAQGMTSERQTHMLGLIAQLDPDKETT